MISEVKEEYIKKKIIEAIKKAEAVITNLIIIKIKLEEKLNFYKEKKYSLTKPDINWKNIFDENGNVKFTKYDKIINSCIKIEELLRVIDSEVKDEVKVLLNEIIKSTEGELHGLT